MNNTVNKERCSYARIGGETFENCREVEEAPKDEGSWWGWLICAISCSNYSGGFDYSYYTDKCTCKGRWMSPMWRR